jgi:hypothetical protein
MSPKKKTEGQRNVTIGSINGNSGPININTGNISIRIEQAFSSVHEAIASYPDISKVEKNDVKADTREVEAALKNPKVDENFVARRLRSIGRIAPDILEVALATIVSPAVGLGKVAEKIAAKAREK